MFRDLLDRALGALFPVLRRIEAKLDRVLSNQQSASQEVAKMETKIDTVTEKIEALTTVGDSMKTLLGTLSTEIAELKTGDPDQDAKLDALAAKIDAKTTEWTAAVVANTPSATDQPGQPAEELPGGLSAEPGDHQE